MYRKNVVTDRVDENPIGITGNASRIKKILLLLLNF